MTSHAEAHEPGAVEHHGPPAANLSSRVDARVPIVVRLDGTNAEQGRRILQEAGHPQIVPAPTMLEAARKAVELAGATTGAA